MTFQNFIVTSIFTLRLLGLFLWKPNPQASALDSTLDFKSPSTGAVLRVLLENMGVTGEAGEA
jgi:hypothetical protein